MRLLVVLGAVVACCAGCGSDDRATDSIVTAVDVRAVVSTSLPAPSTTTNTENQIRVEIADGRHVDGGALFSTTTLDAATATTLANALNDIVPWDFVSGCLFGMQHARYTAIGFAIPGRSDVDLWLKDWIGCPEVGNGARTSGLLVNGQGTAFLAQLDAAAPPAPPTEDFTSTT